MSRGKELDKNKKNSSRRNLLEFRKEAAMKGYHVPSGYMGFVNGRWMLFASERDYYEYLSD